MMRASNQVHVVGKLVAGDIEVARRTGSTTNAKTRIGHAETEIVRHQRVDIDAEIPRVKEVCIRSAEIGAPGERRMERVERGWCEGVCITDGGRLRAFIVAWSGRYQYVRGIEEGRLQVGCIEVTQEGSVF